MLNEEEWEPLHTLLTDGLNSIKRERQETGKRLSEVDIPLHYTAAFDYYENLTGYREIDHNNLWHHRISIYGPPCPNCGVPLRTPQATYCPKCGWETSADKGEIT